MPDSWGQYGILGLVIITLLFALKKLWEKLEEKDTQFLKVLDERDKRFINTLEDRDEVHRKEREAVRANNMEDIKKMFDTISEAAEENKQLVRDNRQTNEDLKSVLKLNTEESKNTISILTEVKGWVVQLWDLTLNHKKKPEM